MLSDFLERLHKRHHDEDLSARWSAANIYFDATINSHLIGCRWRVEGAVDFGLLLKVLRGVFEDSAINGFKVGLLLPEMAGMPYAAKIRAEVEDDVKRHPYITPPHI